jgi:hypothetical protein
MLIEQDDENICIHIAKHVIDDNCIIYDPKVINMVRIDDVVRISFELTKDNDYYWNHDAPFAKIVKIHKDSILGEVQDINRMITNKYPIKVGDRVWFTRDNIIEIPQRYQANQANNIYKKYLTESVVQCTGPLFTIEDSDSDSDSSNGEDNSNDDETVSDSD